MKSLPREPAAEHGSFGTLVLGRTVDTMIDSVSKPKLAKGLSYVLKTSQLAKALSDARIDCHVDLVYWVPQTGGSVLEGHYWLPNENVACPRVYVRAGVVPSASRLVAAEAMLVSALPQFVSWLQEILALPDDSPALHGTLYFNATYTVEGLVVTDNAKYKVRRRTR
jgi:hypothetical protein